MSSDRAGYEVDAKCVAITDPRGFKHYLGRGAALPDWTKTKELEQMLDAGELFTFERI